MFAMGLEGDMAERDFLSWALTRKCIPITDLCRWMHVVKKKIGQLQNCKGSRDEGSHAACVGFAGAD